MFTVYVLQSRKDRKSYVGVTDDLIRRLSEHNSGQNYYTKRHTPWTVIYTEEYATFSEARAREKYLKSGAGREFLKTVFENCRIV